MMNFITRHIFLEILFFVSTQIFLLLKDGDQIWTPCGQDVPKDPKPMSKETIDKLLKAKRSKKLNDFLDEE